MTDPTPTRDEEVPTGWKLVPIEPTDEMLWQANAARRSVSAVQNSRDTWAAMLASAPAPASGDDPDAMLERALFANLRVGRVSAGTSNVTTNDGRRASIQFAVHEPGQRLALSPDIAAASSIYTAPASGGVDAVARAIWNHLHYRHGGDYDGAEGSTARADTDCLARKIVASLSPAATPVSEAGGNVKGWAAVYDGQIKSCHRSRDTCIADAEHYQAIHPVYLGPAWRHQED